jgi:mono/diheme cytochrome c family protein
MLSYLRVATMAAVLIAPGLCSARPTAGIKLHSVKISLRDDNQQFPGGAAAAVVNNNCVACHSASMVLMQPALPAATWQTEVNKMIRVYKAPVSAADVPAIVTYLSQLQPKG